MAFELLVGVKKKSGGRFLRKMKKVLSREGLTMKQEI